MNEFMTPPKHVNFRAKKLFGAVGNIVDGAVAYMDLDGGGPTELHTHEHNHLFIVTEGEAKILLGDEEVIIHKDEAFLVEGRIPHSCWNNIEGVTKMILVGAATLPELFDAILTEYNLGLKYFNIEDAGKVLVRGVKDKGDIKGTSFLEDAYQLGISI